MRPGTRLKNLWLSGAGVRLHAVTAGDPAAPPVVLLHGFPEFWYGWRHQIGPLAAAGLRVIALDQRGYNWSDKPPHVRPPGQSRRERPRHDRREPRTVARRTP